MFEHLNDYDFLLSLDKAKIKTQFVKIVLLDFNENPIREIEGKITSGSLGVNGSAAVRRTINFSMLADPRTSDLENLDNEISLNKKIKVYTGYLNPFKKYNNILWFPCGMYVVATANVNRSTSGWSISLTAKDKMVLLDGTAGGTLPASVTFHESYIYNDDGSVTIVYPTVYQIVQEAVHHWGGEEINNIFINGLDTTAKLLIKYMGDKPIYMNDDYSSFSYNENSNYPHRFIYNQELVFTNSS